MGKLTTRERFLRMFKHCDADRIPILDSPWPSTVERWRREGMPEGVDYVDYFGLDHVMGIFVDSSPRYETKVIEETERYVVHTTPWGVTLRNWKHAASVPEFVNFTIVDPPSWAKAKERMTPTRDRIDWKALERDYRVRRERGDWVMAHLWFGFDATHAWTVGTERILMALMTDPDWCVDMFETFLDVNLELLDMVWDAGYEFDCVFWPDDMGYKGKQFFSVDTYRELLKPAHKRAVDWAHAKGVYAHLHSCGDVRPFVPEFIDIGVDALNPIEVKAGMNPVDLKQRYGDSLVFHGGINAVLWDDPEAIETEMRRVIPKMKESGGYIFASDHSIPESVSLGNFRRIIDLAKQLGSYE